LLPFQVNQKFVSVYNIPYVEQFFWWQWKVLETVYDLIILKILFKMVQVEMSEFPEKNDNNTEATATGDTASDFTAEERGVSSYL